VPPELGAAIAAACLELARSRGMDLLVTTSRRTRPDTEDAVALAASGAAYLCRGRTDPESPVPGMLALADLAVVTEDSVSMVSEAASAPARVLTVAVKRKGLIPARRHRAVLKTLAAGGYVARADAAHVAEAGARLLDGPTPPVLDDTRRCRQAVARLVGA
jgi:mitochondrial fission protein ELM1